MCRQRRHVDIARQIAAEGTGLSLPPGNANGCEVARRRAAVQLGKRFRHDQGRGGGSSCRGEGDGGCEQLAARRKRAASWSEQGRKGEDAQRAEASHQHSND